MGVTDLFIFSKRKNHVRNIITGTSLVAPRWYYRDQYLLVALEIDFMLMPNLVHLEIESSKNSWYWGYLMLPSCTYLQIIPGTDAIYCYHLNRKTQILSESNLSVIQILFERCDSNFNSDYFFNSHFSFLTIFNRYVAFWFLINFQFLFFYDVHNLNPSEKTADVTHSNKSNSNCFSLCYFLHQVPCWMNVVLFLLPAEAFIVVDCCFHWVVVDCCICFCCCWPLLFFFLFVIFVAGTNRFLSASIIACQTLKRILLQMRTMFSFWTLVVVQRGQ